MTTFAEKYKVKTSQIHFQYKNDHPDDDDDDDDDDTKSESTLLYLSKTSTLYGQSWRQWRE